MPETTQKQQVLDYLEAGNTLTSLEAVQRFGITRLAARIYELRQDGHPITDETVTVQRQTGGTANVARYELNRQQGTRFGDLDTGTRFRHNCMDWEKVTSARALNLSEQRLLTDHYADFAAHVKVQIL